MPLLGQDIQNEMPAEDFFSANRGWLDSTCQEGISYTESDPKYVTRANELREFMSTKMEGPFYVYEEKISKEMVTLHVVLFKAEDILPFVMKYPAWDYYEDFAVSTNTIKMKNWTERGWVPKCPRLREFCKSEGLQIKQTQVSFAPPMEP